MKPYEKQNRPAFIGALVCILFSSTFAVVLQFFKGNVLDSAVAGNTRVAAAYALLLIGFILLEVACYYFYRRQSARFVVGCVKHLKRDIWDSILRRSYVAYKGLPQGEYIAKYTAEADTIKERRFAMKPAFCEVACKVLFVSAALFLLDFRIALVTLFLLTTPLYIPKLIEKRLHKAQSEYLAAVAANLAKINDWLSGFEIIKNFAIERHIMKRFSAANDDAMAALLRDTQLTAVAQLITTLISYLSYFIILGFSTWLVLKGDFSAGDFFVAIGMIDQLSYPLISLSGIIRQLVAVKPVCTAMDAFIHDCAGVEAARELTGFRDQIRYENVGFAYDEGRPLLRDFNLVIGKGKRYLFKGASGCGKTTAVNLLLKYYGVTVGEINVDGIPINNIDSTYGLITVVRQEAVLFHDTLRNNLTMYREIGDDALIAMLNSLGMAKYANAQALDGMITESGANLSGGEKKRICLARALLRDTDVLALDEPLANLDDATASKIEDLLLTIRDRTLLVVSHQFSEDKFSAFDRVVDFAALG